MSDKLFRVDNKIALITGGSRGLGLWMAEALLEAGAKKVYISSRKEKACAEAVEHLRALAAKNGLKGDADYIAADLGTREGNEYLFSEYMKRESGLDILIANAGATWGADLAKHPDSAIEKVLNLNVRGVFSNIQLFTPLLVKNGTHEDPSRIIITGSIAGIVSTNPGGVYGYYASKAAVHHLGTNLAHELGPDNVTVNVIAPGFIRTKMASGLIDATGDMLITTNPRRRLGIRDDVVGATLYLCSKAGSYINGTILPLDGGAHLGYRL